MGVRFPQMTAITIRPVSKDDAAVLADIHRECFPHYWQQEAFTDFFSVAGTLGWLVEGPEPTNMPIGMIIYRVLYEQADIITVAVRPAWQRQGIGRKLLVEAMENAKHMGCKVMFLDVEEGNDAAIKLYEAFGFTHVNRRKLYYKQKNGSFTDALVMKRVLG